MFAEKRVLLLYTRAPGSYQRNSRSKRLDGKSAVERDVGSWRKPHLFLEAIEMVDYAATEEVKTTHIVYTNMISINGSLLQPECGYKRMR